MIGERILQFFLAFQICLRCQRKGHNAKVKVTLMRVRASSKEDERHDDFVFTEEKLSACVGGMFVCLCLTATFFISIMSLPHLLDVLCQS